MPLSWKNLLDKNNDFALKTITQLEKDVGYFVQTKAPNSTELNLELLLDWVESILVNVFEKNGEQLFQLLYRVDLPENECQHILLSNHPDKLRKLALAILRREAQKVYWKMKLSE